MKAPTKTRPLPVDAVRGAEPYAPPTTRPTIDLILDANEGRWSMAEAPSEDRSGTPQLSSYPRENELEAALAADFGIEVSQVLVTAGADEALDRVFRAWVRPNSTVILPTPTFVMLPRYAALAGATVRAPAWPGGPYPADAVLDAVDDSTSLIAVVSPNNPTGAVASREDLVRLSEAAPQALILLDAAYAEFAKDDLTECALGLDNVIVTRTFSKAWGLAGCRVGYALGKTELIAPLRATASPYPVAVPSIQIALERRRRARQQMESYVQRIAVEVTALRSCCAALDIETEPSQANFVFARSPRSTQIRDGLASLGIAVRAFGNTGPLRNSLRITCPGNAANFTRLEHALETTLRPEALLFDMDGVLVDVAASYRAAIRATAAAFGAEVSDADIDRKKSAGNANDDWRLTASLIEEQRGAADLAAVTERFEDLYQGSGDRPGLWKRETSCIDDATLRALSARFRLGVVTGRPRADAKQAIETFGWEGLFEVMVCREDAPLKPDPAPVERAVRQLGVERAWMLGDTVDDILSARAAAVLPVGVCPPGKSDDSALRGSLAAAGAATVLRNADQILELLP